MPNVSKHEHTFVTNIMAELSPSSSGLKITPAPKELMQDQLLAVSSPYTWGTAEAYKLPRTKVWFAS